MIINEKRLARALDMLMAGVPALSAAADIPDCFKAMGFERLPEDADSVKAKYRELAKRPC